MRDPHDEVFNQLRGDLRTLMAHRLRNRYQPAPQPQAPAPEQAQPGQPQQSPDFSDEDLSSLASSYEGIQGE